MITPQRIRSRPTPAAVLGCGPFVGCNEGASLPNTAADKRTYGRNLRLAFRMVNLLPLRTEPGRAAGGVRQRPGFTLQYQTGGIPYDGEVQRQIDFRKRAGTLYKVVIAGGEIYDHDTKVIDSSDLSGAGITLNTTGIVYCLVFQDELIVSDGTNKPFMWDGTIGGGLTLLANAQAWYGQPTIHAAKVFAIVAANRGRFVWSEEGDATIGYGTSPYDNNAWDFIQTSNDHLTGLLGGNEALTVIRRDSITQVFGTVDEEFQSGATFDTISETTGSQSPAGIGRYAKTWVLFDSNRLPRRLGPTGLLDFPSEHASYVVAADLHNHAQVQCAVAADSRLAFFTVDLRTSSGFQQRIMVLDLEQNTYHGYLTFVADEEITALNVVTWEVAGSDFAALAVGTADGGVWVMLLDAPGIDIGQARDIGESSIAIPVELVTPMLGRGRLGIKLADSVRVVGLFDRATGPSVKFVANPGGFVGTTAPHAATAVGGTGTLPVGTRPTTAAAGLGPVSAREFMVQIASSALDITDDRIEIHEIWVPAVIGADDPRSF